MVASLKTNESPRVLILGAMDEEIRELLQQMQLQRTEEWNGFTLHFGILDEVSVIVCKTGIGKVFASLITQHLIDSYALRAVLFTGVAGAIAGDLEPGDIIVGETLIYHDFDVAGLGFKTGHIPFTDYRYFETDTRLLDSAVSVKLENANVRAGCIGTGDQFVTDKSRIPELGLDCVDMEGAAVAQVCTVNQLGFLVIRIISDKADGSATVDFAANLPRYAHQSIEVLRRVLAEVK